MEIKTKHGVLIPFYIPPNELNFMDNEEKNRFDYFDNSQDSRETKQLAFRKIQDLIDE